MRRVTALLLIFTLLIFLQISCAKEDQKVLIEVDPSHLRNGSTSIYALYDEKGKSVYTFRDNVFINPDNILIIRELTEQDNEEILRAKLDSRLLSPIQLQIVKSESQTETPHFLGEKKGKSYVITEWDENQNPSYKKIYVGSEQFFEDELLLHLMSCFPLKVGVGGKFKYVNTRKKSSGYEYYKVVGTENIIAANNKYESIKVEIPGNNCTAWFLKDSPHILLKAKFQSLELQLTAWNNI